jgi:hypothetical protein
VVAAAVAAVAVAVVVATSSTADLEKARPGAEAQELRSLAPVTALAHAVLTRPVTALILYFAERCFS